MEEYVCLLPRNLNKPDTIVHRPIKLNWKQIGYIGFGLTGILITTQTSLPLIAKIILSVSSFGLGIIASQFKYKNSSVDELLFDSLTYLNRIHYYDRLKKRGDFIVTINGKKDETTVKNIMPKVLIST